MKNNMTVGDPTKTIISFALPLAAGYLLQQLYNITDTIIIGKFIGSEALAAVGITTNITFLLLAIASGLSMGTSVVISQYYGAGNNSKAKSVLFTGLISSVMLGCCVMVIGLIIKRGLLWMIKTPESAFSMADSYLKIYLYGILFLFLFNIANSIFQAFGDSKTPFFVLLISSIINVVLDIIFVKELIFGVKGAAYATVIAEVLSTLVSAFFLYHKIEILHTDNFVFFNVGFLKKIVKVAIPSILQRSIVSVCSMSVQALINGCGASVVAGYTASTKIDSIASSPMVNIGTAFSTYSAQNIGAEKNDRVKEGIKGAVCLDLWISILIVLIAFMFSNQLMGLFVKSGSGADVIVIGTEHLKIVCLGNFLQGTMHIFGGLLRGAGDLKGFLATFSCNMISRVIFAYLLFYLIGRTGIWISLVVGWLIGTIVGIIIYRRGKWKEKRLKRVVMMR